MSKQFHFGARHRDQQVSPLLAASDLRGILAKHGVRASSWVFEPRKCDQGPEECDCTTSSADYGCIRARCP